MDNIWIENPKNFRKPIPLTSIFGEDSEKLYKECRCVMRDWLYPYEVCSSPDSPKTFNFGARNIRGNHISKECKPINQEWLWKVPEEKVSISRANWRILKNSHFKTIFDIAHKHNVNMKWCGNDSNPCGDQWSISKGSEEIGILRVWD